MTTNTPCCWKCAPSEDIIPSIGEELKRQGKYGCWNDECECHTPQESCKKFAKELSEKVRYFAGKGQYDEEPERRSAYLDGVETAIGMMYIDLTGTPKSVGMLQNLLSTAHSQGVEEGITYIANNQGWEETEDVYREHFGLPLKYKNNTTDK